MVSCSGTIQCTQGASFEWNIVGNFSCLEAVVHGARNPAVVGALEKMTMVGAFAELGFRNY